jgi:hypothetical protein
VLLLNDIVITGRHLPIVYNFLCSYLYKAVLQMQQKSEEAICDANEYVIVFSGGFFFHHMLLLLQYSTLQ